MHKATVQEQAGNLVADYDGGAVNLRSELGRARRREAEGRNPVSPSLLEYPAQYPIAERLEETLAPSGRGQAMVPSLQLGQSVTVTIAEPMRQSQVQRLVAPQQVAMRVGQLAQDNRTDQARVLACELARAAPEYEVGREMCLALNEVKVPPEVQNRQVVALAERARQELEVVGRQMEVRRKLDDRLWTLALGEGRMATAVLSPTDVAACNNMVPLGARQLAADAGIVLRELPGVGAAWGSGVRADSAGDSDAAMEQGALVTVLVTGTDAATMALLRGAGFVVEDVQARASVVVGVIPVGRLAELALLECVRRVEPTPGE